MATVPLWFLNCSQRPDGHYVWGCSSFYVVCSNGMGLVRDCPNPEENMFNPETNSCQARNETGICTLIEPK